MSFQWELTDEEIAAALIANPIAATGGEIFTAGTDELIADEERLRLDDVTQEDAGRKIEMFQGGCKEEALIIGGLGRKPKVIFSDGTKMFVNPLKCRFVGE